MNTTFKIFTDKLICNIGIDLAAKRITVKVVASQFDPSVFGHSVLILVVGIALVEIIGIEVIEFISDLDKALIAHIDQVSVATEPHALLARV